MDAGVVGEGITSGELLAASGNVAGIEPLVGMNTAAVASQIKRLHMPLENGLNQDTITYSIE